MTVWTVMRRCWANRRAITTVQAITKTADKIEAMLPTTEWEPVTIEATITTRMGGISHAARRFELGRGRETRIVRKKTTPITTSPSGSGEGERC